LVPAEMRVAGRHRHEGGRDEVTEETDTNAEDRRPNVGEAQAPLRVGYRREPEAALIVDRGRTLGTGPGDPFHLRAQIGAGYEGAELDVGVHRGVGGLHDEPNPGELLCTALAACQDQVLRMAANLCGVELAEVRAEVTGEVDLRGTLIVDPEVRVGFQSMRCVVHFTPAPGSDERQVERLIEIAERCCVVADTLRHGVPVESEFRIGDA
jgi:uncharacterized OsmC-like protein